MYEIIVSLKISQTMKNYLFANVVDATVPPNSHLNL